MTASILLAGCASTPYQYGVAYPTPLPANCTPEEARINVERGRSNKIIDGAGWVFGLPERIVLWNWRAGNHRISEETESALCEYLVKNELSDVKVRVNQYDPLGEWRRLGKNYRMGGGWRYTLGTLSVVGYTLIPGRVFGGDYYNPYTNTVNVYSDVPAIAVQEAAYAKDLHNRKHPGTYATINELPLVSMWHETVNTNDALGYFAVDSSTAQQREAYYVLGPRYGTHAGGAFRSLMRPAEGAFVLGGGVFSLAGALVGHAVGRIEAPLANQPPTALSDATASRSANRTSDQPFQADGSDASPEP